VASGAADEDSPGPKGGADFAPGVAFPAPWGGAFSAALSPASSSASGGGVAPGGGSGLCAREPESVALDEEFLSESPDVDGAESESEGGATLLDSPLSASPELLPPPLPGLGEADAVFGSVGGGKWEGSCIARAGGEPIKNNAPAASTGNKI